MTTPTSIEANKELVRTYTQTGFNEHHTDRASDFLAGEVKWHGGTLGTAEGLDNVAALVGGIHRSAARLDGERARHGR